MKSNVLPQYDENEECYYVEIPINNQTLYMAFQIYYETWDTLYFNIYLNLYNKRTRMDYNLEHKIMTGLNPLATIHYGIKAFDTLEKHVLSHYQGYNVHISCVWEDNRRRDAYWAFLSKRGYRYGKDVYGNKVIYRKYKKERN